MLDEVWSVVQLREVDEPAIVWTREAEKSSLLKAVAWERLVKTLQAGEDLVFAAVIYKVWRLAMAL
jgi:hypothetical protein